MKTRRYGSTKFSARPRGQEGSAYLITLLSLVVLTMLALALTFTTQTELIVGSNERTIQRAFYAAESGVHMAVAFTLASHNKCRVCESFDDVPQGPGSDVDALIEYDDIHPIAAPWCNLCSVNDVDEYQSNAFFKVNHTITARSFLVHKGEEAARKVISDMIDVQPWKDANPPERCELAPLKCLEKTYGTK